MFTEGIFPFFFRYARVQSIQQLLEQLQHVKTFYSGAKSVSVYTAAVATTHVDALTGFKLADTGTGNGAAEEMQRSA